MPCTQFQSQAPSYPHETVSLAHCRQRPMPHDSRQKPLLLWMFQGPLEQLPHLCFVPHRRGDPDTQKAVQLFGQYVG